MAKKFLVGLAVCLIWFLNPGISQAAVGEWTWINGSNTINQAGVYGTKGVPDADNIPGARYSSISWTGSDGSLWLLGGYGYGITTTSGSLNDLWRYDPVSNMWTWVNGSNTIDQAPVYGTNGIPDAANVPGARSDAISWTGSDGNLWLFGGYGLDALAYYGNLNDLWRYDVTTNIWTWISGSKTGSQKGTYGNKGVPHSSNIPGARFRSISWIDTTGNLWLFGGSGLDYIANHGELNDLWRYDPGTNQWTWMSGSNTREQIGTYGTNGFPDAANVPGSRDRCLAWPGSDGNLWLFGGDGYASEGSPGRLNDLWAYQLVECVLDSNCDETNICKQGFCIPKCMSDDDCIGGEQCQTNTGKCVECLSDTDCDDGIICNGAETCDEETCVTGDSPCNDGLFCDESNDLCAQCLTNSDCSAREACVANRCVTQYFSWIPDTGQTQCYDSTGEITCPQPGEAFYGQDAQHTRARSYTDLGNDIVRDDVTGLEWQQSPSLGATYWESALNYCSNLTLGGYSDWRLPTIDELQTLVDSSRKDPAINTTSFKGTVTDPGYSYWSATTYLPDIDDVWNVDFFWGNTTRAPKENWLHYLRAVRGEMPANNFIDNGDGTVTDTSTGLMWQQAATISDEYNWQQALAYCENLSLAGYSDWRLPDRNELRSIIDYNSYDPAIDTNFFSVGDPAWCWSSTTNYYYPNHAFGVSESTGHTTYGYKQNQYAVRAVRSFVCIDDSDCDDGYECIAGACNEIADQPPVFLSEPLWVGPWVGLSTNPASPHTPQSQHVLFWAYDDDKASCTGTQVHWMYRPVELQDGVVVPLGDWVAQTPWRYLWWVWIEAPGIADIPPAPGLYEFKITVSDCRDQMTDSEVFWGKRYYFRVE